MLDRLHREITKAGLYHTIERSVYKTVEQIVQIDINELSFGYKLGIILEVIKAKRVSKKLESKGLGKDIRNYGLKRYKDSDTVFILGSGSSINNISARQWKEVEKHDSIGINRWPVHPHIPSFLVFEIPWFKCEKFTSEYFELLRQRSNDYWGVPKIIKGISLSSLKYVDVSKVPDSIYGNIVISRDSGFNSLVGWDSSDYKNLELLRSLKEYGYFKDGSFQVQYKKRGSVSYALHLAKVLGYTEIVLCGVDMDDGGHFFDFQNENTYSKKYIVPRHSDSPAKKSIPHKTVDSNFGNLTLDKVVKNMYSSIFEHEDINIFVESDTSKLYPYFDIYEF